MTDLIQNIEEWIEDGASFPVQLQLLTVDSSCSVGIGSFIEFECRAGSGPTNSDGTTRPTSDNTGLIIIIGAVVVIAFILVLITVIVAIIVALCRKSKRQGSFNLNDSM